MHHHLRHWLDRVPVPIDAFQLARATGRHVVAPPRADASGPGRPAGPVPPC